MNIRQFSSEFFRMGLDVIASSLSSATGALIANLGDSSSNYRDSDQCDVWNATQGVTCIPAVPTPGQPSCQAIVLSGGNRDTVIAMRDVRKMSALGTMAPGDSCLWETSNGSARIYARATGEIDIIANSGSNSITIDPTGKISVTGTSAVVNVSGDATVNATTVEIGSAATSITIGGGAVLPSARATDPVQAGPFSGTIISGSLITKVG